MRNDLRNVWWTQEFLKAKFEKSRLLGRGILFAENIGESLEAPSFLVFQEKVQNKRISERPKKARKISYLVPPPSRVPPPRRKKHTISSKFAKILSRD